jgi:hypothetical protein
VSSNISRLAVLAAAALALLGGIYVGFAHTDKAARVAALIAGKPESQREQAERVAERQTTALRAEEERMAAEMRDAEERTRLATETAARTSAPERVASIGPQPDNAAAAVSPNAEERANYVRKVREALRAARCYDASGGDVSGVQNALDRFVENAHKRGKDKPSRIELTKATTTDFDDWLRGANEIKGEVCSIPAKSAAPVRQRPIERAPSRPQPSYRSGGSSSESGGGSVVQGVR